MWSMLKQSLCHQENELSERRRAPRTVSAHSTADAQAGVHSPPYSGSRRPSQPYLQPPRRPRQLPMTHDSQNTRHTFLPPCLYLERPFSPSCPSGKPSTSITHHRRELSQTTRGAVPCSFLGPPSNPPWAVKKPCPSCR